MSVRLGDLLIKKQLLSRQELESGLQYQREHGGRLGSVLMKLGFVSDEALAAALSEQYSVPSVNLATYEIDQKTLHLIPLETAIRHQVIPLKQTGTTLIVATADPANVLALDEIKFMTGLRVEPVVAPENMIREAIERFFGDQQSIELQKVYDQLSADGAEYDIDISQKQKIDIAELERSSSEAPIIKLVNIILGDSIRKGASDIHLEPYETEFRVRFRLDGVLYTIMRPPFRLRDAIISRLKIMANLDISERRLPQDGRIKISISQGGKKKKIDFRVSSLPTLFGEKLVLRLLDPEKLPDNLSKLGFHEAAMDQVQAAIGKPYGMFLVTGPTGSGKTSTLYTCLSQLNTENVNIMTAEDPVEFNFPGINQVQINEQIGRTFAGALRAFLRQDPNIIMVGEIRDLETAEIAIKAALTGHLVLSTLHTNDAPSTIGRLLNMGVEPFLVASSVQLICAQRLVRRICPECKEEDELTPAMIRSMRITAIQADGLIAYRGKGCSNCNDSGYKGRTGLFEVMEMTPDFQELILNRAGNAEIRRMARENGMLTLREIGLEKVKAGITTMEEVLKETAFT